MKSVSIVIPTFNRVDFVKESIESALEQTVSCEVIVCDHGSTDSTPDLMKNYSTVNYIRREADFGPHFCWLEGIQHAKGEYVHLQFDDDWISPLFIEKTLAQMREDVGFCFGNTQVFSQSTGDFVDLFAMKDRGFVTGVYPNSELRKLLIEERMMISPGACLFRKQDMIDALYQGNLPFNNDVHYHGVGPDYFMTLLTLLRYQYFGFVSDDIAFFRDHVGSITMDSKGDAEKDKQFQQAYASVRDFFLLLEKNLPARTDLSGFRLLAGKYANKISTYINYGK